MLRMLLVVLFASFLALSREEITFSDPTVAVGTWVEVFGLDQNNLSDYLNVQETPSLSGKENHHLYNDYVAYIDEGPVETEGYRWWHLANLGWAVDNWLRVTYEEKIPKEPQGRILFTQYGENSYYTFLNIINADGTNKENLMVFPNQFCGLDPYTWSPDGKEIAFVDCGGTEDNPNYQINKLNIETKEIVTLASTPGPSSGPSWSPDGNSIAFYSEIYLATEEKIESIIYVLDLKTSGIIQVTDIDSSDPDWSPDSKSLVFNSGIGTSGDLFVANIEERNTNKIFSSEVTFDPLCCAGPIVQPSWSPVGDKIAFTCADTRSTILYLEEHKLRICTINADGSEINKLTSEQENFRSLPYCTGEYYSEPTQCYQPHNRFSDWSPDGKQVVFNGITEFTANRRGDLNGNFDIFIINSDGTNFRPLTEGIYPKWQPTTVMQVPTVTPPTPTAIPPTPTQEIRFVGKEPTPILLVHGCGGSAYDWEETGWVSGLSLIETYTDLLPFTEIYLYQAEVSIFADSAVFSLDYSNSGASLEETAQIIPRSLDSIKSVTAAEKVIIISHSMGAILTRYYLEDFLEEKYSERSDISVFLMLAPPNNGSFWVNMGLEKVIDLLKLQCPQAGSLNSEDLEPLNSKELSTSVSTYRIAAGNQCWFIFIGFNDCVVTTKDAKIDGIPFTQYSAVHSDLLPLALEQAVFPELTPILEHEQTKKIVLQIYEEVVK